MKLLLSIEINTTGVPYSRPGDDPDSHSYIRLKDNLGAIDMLPECVKDKTLSDCVHWLNRPESVLETIGCECIMNVDQDVLTDNGIEPIVYRKKGYIGLIFSDLRLGRDSTDWWLVFRLLSEKLASEPANAVNFEFTICPCNLHKKEAIVWLVDLWLSTSWTDEVTSAKMWDAWMKTIVWHLDEIATMLVGEIES